MPKHARGTTCPHMVTPTYFLNKHARTCQCHQIQKDLQTNMPVPPDRRGQNSLIDQKAWILQNSKYIFNNHIDSARCGHTCKSSTESRFRNKMRHLCNSSQIARQLGNALEAYFAYHVQGCEVGPKKRQHYLRHSSSQAPPGTWHTFHTCSKSSMDVDPQHKTVLPAHSSADLHNVPGLYLSESSFQTNFNQSSPSHHSGALCRDKATKSIVTG